MITPVQHPAKCATIDPSRGVAMYDHRRVSVTLQILGRSNSIADYVKKGESEGFTEIYLSKDTNGSRIVVKRVMKKEGTSTWKLNGTTRSQQSGLHHRKP